MLITTSIQRTAATDPSRRAVVTHGATITYGELLAQAERVAMGLRARLGPSANGPICLLASDPLVFLPAFLGIAMAGGQAMPLSPDWTDAELDSATRVAPPVAVLAPAAEQRGPSWLPLETLGAGASAEDPLPDGAPRDIFYIGFTSGSTGAPKAFARDHAAWVRSFEAMSAEFGIADGSSAVVAGSLFFSFPLIAALHGLATGGTIHLPASSGAPDVLTACPAEPSTLFALPSVLDQAAHLAIRRGMTPAVDRMVCGGEPLRQDSLGRIGDAFPDTELFEFYGASEFGFATVQDRAGRDSKPTSVGRAFRGVELSIGAPGAKSPPGITGELFVRNGYGPVFTYEEGRPPIALGDWRTAHDVAWKDADGFYHLAGRTDTMVVIRGENVHLERVEQVTGSLPGILHAAAVAWPPGAPTHVAAVVVRAAGGPSARAIIAFCREYLSASHRPRRCIFVGSLPLNPSGKLDRPAVQAIVSRAQAGDRSSSR